MDEEPGRTRQASGLTFDDSGFADSDASFTARRRKKSSVAHESDHDACPYISIRRSAKCLHLIKSLRKTSPFSFPNILASFSVKNDFMFYPPYPTYFFSKLENGELGIGNRERYSLVKDTGNPKYTDSYVVPQLRVGAVHGLPTSQDQVGGAASFEIVFIPWNFELQCYRVKGDEVVMEQKFSFRSKLFAFSFGCSMPCSIIRPKHRMSSHIAIFFHCNGEDIGKSSSMRLLSLANALHMTVFAPEYPGYGLFEGSPSETSAKAAAEHFIQYLFAVNPTLTPSRIVLMGHSIGTGFAMHIADYINTIFNKIQDKFCRGCVCPLAYLSDLKAQKKKSFFHPAHKYHCTGEERCGREPFAESDDDSHAVEKGGRIRCAHNTLAGIILLSPFASIHCVEYKNTLRKYNLHPSSLEMRMWNSPNNIVFPAPGSWADDCSTFDKSLEGDLPHLIPDPPLLFRMSRYLSFNRLPTLEVAAELQEKQEYFNYTPLLLVHGTADTLVPAYNSVAIATKLRQCSNGQSARVFLSLLKDNTHNNLECLSQCRRFYKSEILEPHLKRQKEFMRDLYNAARGCDNVSEDHFGPLEFSMGETMEASQNFTIHMTRENTGDPDENAVASRPLSVRSDSSDVETMLKREYLYFMNVPRQPSVPAGGGQTDLGDSLLVSRQQSMVSETVSLNSSLLHTVGRTYPGDYEQCLVPAATAIHITMYCPPDCFDIGSIAVSAVQKYSLSLEEARHLRKQHLRRKTTAGCFRSLLYILPAMFVLGLGVAHAVLLQEKRLEQYMAENGIVGVTAQQLSLDSRVVVWAVLESVVLFVLFVQHCLSPLLSLGHRSRRSPHRPIAVRVYDITVILNIVLCVAVGVLMGMIVSLTPHSRGGVEWSKWTVLPYSRRVWVSYLPRWCMLAIACFHLTFTLMIIIINH